MSREDVRKIHRLAASVYHQMRAMERTGEAFFRSRRCGSAYIGDPNRLDVP